MTTLIFDLRNFPSGHIKSLRSSSVYICTLSVTHNARIWKNINYKKNCKFLIPCKVNQSHYMPEVPRGFQGIKVPELRENCHEY